MSQDPRMRPLFILLFAILLAFVLVFSDGVGINTFYRYPESGSNSTATTAKMTTQATSTTQQSATSATTTTPTEANTTTNTAAETNSMDNSINELGWQFFSWLILILLASTALYYPLERFWRSRKQGDE
jgi:hypothetical protein